MARFGNRQTAICGDPINWSKKRLSINYQRLGSVDRLRFCAMSSIKYARVYAFYAPS